MRATLRISFLVSLFLLLTACGQQGPLVPAGASPGAADSAAVGTSAVHQGANSQAWESRL